MVLKILPFLCLFAGAAWAQTAGDGRFVPGSDLDGIWEGHLSNGGMGLPMTFVLSTAPGKTTTAVLDILDPASNDIPVAGVRRENMTVYFDIPAVGGKFDGLVSADLATISGRWTQVGASGASVPLILKRKAP